MGQWLIWFQIVHLARQMAIFLCSESPQPLDFQGLAGFLRWQSGWQISCFEHASHQLSCALQICLLHMGVNIAHGSDIRPPADDLHGLLIHAAAAADRGECVPLWYIKDKPGKP